MWMHVSFNLLYAPFWFQFALTTLPFGLCKLTSSLIYICEFFLISYGSSHHSSLCWEVGKMSYVIFHCKNWELTCFYPWYHLKNLMMNQIWLEENNHCICERWKFKFKCNDCYIEICCELWNFKLGITLSRDLYCTLFFKILKFFAMVSNMFQ
jgi:hypothetical protein